MLSVEEMEGKEVSECSSGCESGWTMYLNQSEGNPWDPACKAGGGEGWNGEEEEDDDLSMISDASSGPPHFHEDDALYCHQCGENVLCYCFSSASSVFSAAATSSARKDGKRRRVEAEYKHAKNYHLPKAQGQAKPAYDGLDDTASSPLFSFSQNVGINTYGSNIGPVENVVELSYGFSATHFKGKASLGKYPGYLNPNPGFRANKW